MPEPTDYQIKCRGCREGTFVNLMRKTKPTGIGRFYYTHAKGCKHMEDFDPDIDSVDELRRLVPDIPIRSKAAAIVLAKGDEEKTPPPLTKVTAPKETPPKEPETVEKGGRDDGLSFF